MDVPKSHYHGFTAPSNLEVEWKAPFDTLTLFEVATVLRCSKAHVSNILRGKVSHLPPLPVVRIGRRVLIRAVALVDWIRTVETLTAGVR